LAVVESCLPILQSKKIAPTSNPGLTAGEVTDKFDGSVSTFFLTFARPLGQISPIFFKDDPLASHGSFEAAGCLCLPSRLENLFDILTAVLVRRLKVMQLLLQIGDIRLQFRRLTNQTLVDGRYRRGYEPGNAGLLSVALIMDPEVQDRNH
jgi:hypothetical protein